MTILTAALALAFVLPTTLSMLPGLDRLWVSRAAARLISQHPPAAGGTLVAVGYSEPSLVFLLGGNVHLATPRGAGELLANGGEALVASREQPTFLQAVAARRLTAQAVARVPGVDYSNGQHMVLTLYAVAPA